MKLIGFFFLILVTAAHADEKYNELLKRIEELEAAQSDLQLEVSAKRPQTSSFLNDNLALGGFFEPSYTYIDGPDTKTQTANSANILGLNLAADYQNNLRFVSQFITGLSLPLSNPNNNPNAAALNQPKSREFGNVTFGAVLTQGYLEYTANQNLVIQGGMGYVPFGFAPQQRELVLFIRRGGPQLFRTRLLISQLWSGINLQGTKRLDDSTLGYNLYTFSPLEGATQPGVGGRLSLASENESVLGGLSVQTGKIEEEDFTTVGTDLRIVKNRFLLTAELAYGFFEFADPWSAYIEPAFFIVPDEVLLYVFADYSENTKNRLTTLSSPDDSFQKWEYGTGINWLPTSYTRLRLGVTLNDYVGGSAVVNGQDRDYVSVDASVGVAF